MRLLALVFAAPEHVLPALRPNAQDCCVPIRVQADRRYQACRQSCSTIGLPPARSRVARALPDCGSHPLAVPLAGVATRSAAPRRLRNHIVEQQATHTQHRLLTNSAQPREMRLRPFAVQVYPAELLLSNGSLDTDSVLRRKMALTELGLKPRDIVSLFSKDGRMGFDLGVRSGSLFLSLGKDGPAVIVSNVSAWIIHRGDTSRKIGNLLQHQLQEVRSMDQQEKEEHGEPHKAAPFPLAVTEAVLVMSLKKLTSNLRYATAEGAALLEGFALTGSARVSTFNLETLRRTKQRLTYLREQAKSLQTTLFEALGDEDDMAQLEESVGHTQEEWELCFEYYSQSAEEVALEAFRQLEALEDLESSISLSFSCRRLELEKLQLYLDVLSNGLGFGALLTGAFGMNLVSGLEDRGRFLWPVFASIIFSCATLCCSLRWWVARRLRYGGPATMWVPSGGGRWTLQHQHGRRRTAAADAISVLPAYRRIPRQTSQ